MKEKELFLILKYPKQFCEIIIGYKVKLFSYHKNMVDAATPSEYQRVMCWQLIIKEFGTDIQNIAGFDNVIDYTLNIIPPTLVNNYNTITNKYRYCANELFETFRL